MRRAAGIPRLLNSREIYEAFMMPGEEYGTWGEGSCWRLAAAVKRWAKLSGVPAETVVLRDLVTMGERSARGVEHVLVRSGDCYVDSWGVWDAKSLLRHWWDYYGLGLYIDRAPSARELERRDIPRPGPDMKRLGAILFDRLGPLDSLLRKCHA